MAFGGKTPFFFSSLSPLRELFLAFPCWEGTPKPPPQDPAPCPRMGSVWKEPKPHREELKEAVYGKYPNFREKKRQKRVFLFRLEDGGVGGVGSSVRDGGSPAPSHLDVF